VGAVVVEDSREGIARGGHAVIEMVAVELGEIREVEAVVVEDITEVLAVVM
jgi:hypothetical protein